MTTQKRNPEDIFHRAVEIIDPTERSAYLDGACGDNLVLKQEVEALLKAHEQAGDFLESPPVDSSVTLDIDTLSLENRRRWHGCGLHG